MNIKDDGIKNEAGKDRSSKIGADRLVLIASGVLAAAVSLGMFLNLSDYKAEKSSESAAFTIRKIIDDVLLSTKVMENYEYVDNIYIASLNFGALPKGFEAKISGQDVIIKNTHEGNVLFFGSDSVTPVPNPSKNDQFKYIHVNYTANFKTVNSCITFTEKLNDQQKQALYIDGVAIRNTLDASRINDIWNADALKSACSSKGIKKVTMVSP